MSQGPTDKHIANATYTLKGLERVDIMLYRHCALVFNCDLVASRHHDRRNIGVASAGGRCQRPPAAHWVTASTCAENRRNVRFIFTRHMASEPMASCGMASKQCASFELMGMASRAIAALTIQWAESTENTSRGDCLSTASYFHPGSKIVLVSVHT